MPTKSPIQHQQARVIGARTGQRSLGDRSTAPWRCTGSRGEIPTGKLKKPGIKLCYLVSTRENWGQGEIQRVRIRSHCMLGGVQPLVGIPRHPPQYLSNFHCAPALSRWGQWCCVALGKRNEYNKNNDAAVANLLHFFLLHSSQGPTKPTENSTEKSGARASLVYKCN